MASGKTPTKPALWSRIKSRITAGTKGGRSGQWSAIKSNLALIVYRKAGGSWKQTGAGGSRSESSMKKWNDEDWQTRDGSKNAKLPGGKMKRYLPRAKWHALTASQASATDRKKRKGAGQYVPNTRRAKGGSR